MGFLTWIEDSGVGVYVRESLWGYPIILSLHAIGMAAVVGVVFMLCLRVLGFAKGTSLSAYESLFTLAWIGFIVNLLSGIMLFASSATIYFFQWIFQVKILAIILGGVAVKLLIDNIKKNSDETKLKIIASVTVVLWFCAILAGRLMAYVA